MPRLARSLAMLLALALVGGHLASSASGDDLSIRYEGEVDTDGPLVMDTTDAADPVTLTSPYQSEPSVVISRMPVTKTITGVTLGAFSVSPGCSSQTANLVITKSGSTTRIASTTGSAPVPSQPGRLRWTLTAPLILKAGEAYDFSVRTYGPEGSCSWPTQTTWAHNSTRVEAVARNGDGTNNCQRSPAGYNHTVAMLWHEYGNDDGRDPCIHAYWSPRKFDATYPSGWLVAGTYNGDDWYVRTVSRDPSSSATCTTLSQQAGTQDVFWRVTPANALYNDYVCAWPHFASFGTTTRYGWWYAQFINSGSRAAQPRAAYVKLDTVDWDNTLLQRYAPALKYDSTERYMAEAVEGVPSLYGSNCGDGPDGVVGLYKRLQDGTPFQIAGTGPGNVCSGDGFSANVLTMDGLIHGGGEYPYWIWQYQVEPFLSEAEDFLDLRQSYAADSEAIFSNPDWANRTYGRVYQDPNGTLWLQYWFWYYYNDGDATVGIDDHEGDWEGIQLRFPNPLVPIRRRTSRRTSSTPSLLDATGPS